MEGKFPFQDQSNKVLRDRQKENWLRPMSLQFIPVSAKRFERR
jgi:hypothetical protein